MWLSQHFRVNVRLDLYHIIPTWCTNSIWLWVAP